MAKIRRNGWRAFNVCIPMFEKQGRMAWPSAHVRKDVAYIHFILPPKCVLCTVVIVKYMHFMHFHYLLFRMWLREKKLKTHRTSDEDDGSEASILGTTFRTFARRVYATMEMPAATVKRMHYI